MNRMSKSNTCQQTVKIDFSIRKPLKIQGDHPVVPLVLFVMKTKVALYPVDKEDATQETE